MTDIAKQRQAERSPRDSEERFREIVENLPMAVGIYDAKGCPLFFNGRFTELLRYRIDDVPTLHDWARRSFPDEEQRRQAFTVWAEDIRNLRSGQVPHSPVREYHFTCGDGVVRDIEVSFSLVADHFYVVFNDVTERNRAEHQLREVLRVQALRDPLTSLYNRRYLDEILESEFSRAARIHGSIGIVMADIDHFKHVNDTFGHDCGDEILRVVAQFLRDQLRKSDIVCRYGGEEFTIVMPGAILEEAHRRTASICVAIREVKISCGGRALGPVTMSFGAAAFPQHGDAPDIVLKAADRALLRAKAEGRDRVIVAGP
ncbi:MAG TPA: sensor domain-containing diguanylate cyclase [Alphaproteobacteria bacterium]|nr:sensor domain-containing diguanylate cyclase [Alphaproteobacteria bacterium]